LDLPLNGSGVSLVGISNSLDLYTTLSEYYDKYPKHRIKGICFKPYTSEQFKEIIIRKIVAEFGSEELVDKLISKDALHFLAMKFSSLSGDARNVFNIVKTLLLLHAEQSNENPISIKEMTEAVNEKCKSKTSRVLKSLARDHKMIAAALYLKMKSENKDTYNYNEVYRNLGHMEIKIGLERTSFSNFCESISILEFYGILKTIPNKKDTHSSKVILKLAYRYQ